MSELRTIQLGGVLGKRFGRVHRLAVANAAEAVHALGSLLGGFDAFLTQAKDKGMGFAVFYGKDRSLTEDELTFPVRGEDVIRIVPMVLGAKSGWVRIIIGAVLVIVGYVLTAFGYGAIGVPLANMGWAMIIGGVIQLLTPVPKGQSSRDKGENTPSYSFNGPVNTQAQGATVPVLYGELIVGSAVVSAGINAVDQAFIPHTTSVGGGNGHSGGGGSTTYMQ